MRDAREILQALNSGDGTSLPARIAPLLSELEKQTSLKRIRWSDVADSMGISLSHLYSVRKAAAKLRANWEKQGLLEEAEQSAFSAAATAQPAAPKPARPAPPAPTRNPQPEQPNPFEQVAKRRADSGSEITITDQGELSRITLPNGQQFTLRTTNVIRLEQTGFKDELLKEITAPQIRMLESGQLTERALMDSLLETAKGMSNG